MKRLNFLGMLFLALSMAFYSCNNNDPEKPDFPDEGDPVETKGSGTEADPYNVKAAQENQGTKDNTDYKYVTGYIVGIWEGKDAAGTDLHPNNFAKFEAPFYTNVNILLADSKDAKNRANLLCVQLPVGAIRTALNLVDNADTMLGTEVTLCGALESYNTMKGMKNTCYYKLADGTSGGTKPGETVGEGVGTKDSPYDVGAAKANQKSQKAWVKGYIVGGIKVGSHNSVTSNADVVFGAEDIRETAVLIAGSPNSKNYEECIVVNLPTGDIRAAVNLVANAGNLGEEIMFYGTLRTYFGMAGVRDLEGYWLRGAGIDPDAEPVLTDPDPVTSLTENFESFTSGNGSAYFSTQTNNKGWNGFTTAGTLEPDVRTYGTNKYVQFSAHRSSISTAIEQEFWLVSPRLDLTNATSKVLSFETVGGYFNDNTVFEVYIIDGSDPATATKIKLEGWRLASTGDLAGDYTPFIPSGDIDLSSHTGTKRIAFYYKGQSGSRNSTTYQLDNFKFGN